MLKKMLSLGFSETRSNILLLLLRISSAGLMIPHGYKKLMHFAEKQDTFMDFMGIGSSASLALTIGAEFFCAILLLVGLLTRFSLLPLLVAMLVAVFDAHHGEIFGDGEHAILYLTAYLAIFIGGAGKYSLDAVIFKK